MKQYYWFVICIFIIMNIGSCLLYLYKLEGNSYISIIIIEDITQRKYYLECLRSNHINFAIKDNGEILILDKKSYQQLELMEDKFYQAFKQKNKEVCQSF